MSSVIAAVKKPVPLELLPPTRISSLTLLQLLCVLVLSWAGCAMTTPASRLVPPVAESVEQAGTSLFNIWTHALRNQKDVDGSPLLRTEPGPRTILSPAYGMVVNLVPQDGPHPLYSPKYTDLRTEFLLDYMIEELISPEDPRLLADDGLTVKNMNGKDIHFKKTSEGKISVAGQEIEEVKQLSEGLAMYQLSGLLFDHQKRVHEAFEVLLKEAPKYGPFGRPLNLPMPPPPQPPQP